MGLLVGHSDALERLVGERLGLVIGLGADERADHDVLEHGHARKRAHDLEGAADAACANLVRLQTADLCAGETHAAFVGREEAVDDIEQVVLPAPFGPIMP